MHELSSNERDWNLITEKKKWLNCQLPFMMKHFSTMEAALVIHNPYSIFNYLQHRPTQGKKRFTPGESSNR